MPAWSPDGRDDRVRVGSARRAASTRSTSRRGVEQPAGRRCARRDRGGRLWRPTERPSPSRRSTAPSARLMVGANNIADAAEDVFPFRPQWISADEVLYTADGKSNAGPSRAARRATIEFSARRGVHAHAVHAQAARVRRTRRRSRCAASCIRPSRPTARGSRSRALGDLWLAPTTEGERHAGAPHQRRLRRHRSGVVAGWPAAGVLRPIATGRWTCGSAICAAGVDRKLASGAWRAAWSPDGTRIAFLDADAELHVVDVATGQTRKVARSA